MTNLAVQRRKKGFTLIELMVSVAVFAIVTTMVAGLFIFAIRIQRKILVRQELLDQVSYVTEYISRSLRTAKKASDASCLSAAGTNYELSRDGLGIKFINDRQECEEIFLDQTVGKLKESRAGTENIITGSSLKVLSFKLMLNGAAVADQGLLQPRVTFLLQVQRVGQRYEEQASVYVQSTISQRDLNLAQ